jgi:hypothetical protein
MIASSESGHPIGDPGAYVLVEEPSTPSDLDIGTSQKGIIAKPKLGPGIRNSSIAKFAVSDLHS